MRTRMRGLAPAAGLTAGAVLASAGAAGPAVADPGVPAATDDHAEGGRPGRGEAEYANWPLAHTRNLCHMVRQSDWAGPAEGPHLSALLNRSVNNGWLCADGAARITGCGFRTPARGCGLLQAGD